MYTNMLNQTENPALLRSGFTLAGANYMDVTISINRIAAGSGYIPQPKSISNKKVTKNPKNDDDACFMRATLTALHSHEILSHSECVSKLKPYGNRYDWSAISYPTHPRDIRLWEATNHIRVNVLGWDGSFSSLRMMEIATRRLLTYYLQVI